MYEKGETIRVTVDISEQGVTELQFIGKVLIDASDFMAIQFDTIIIPKVEIKSAEPVPEEPLEEVLGTTISHADDVKRPKPPKVENVRFLPLTPEGPKQKPHK